MHDIARSKGMPVVGNSNDRTVFNPDLRLASSSEKTDKLDFAAHASAAARDDPESSRSYDPWLS